MHKTLILLIFLFLLSGGVIGQDSLQRGLTWVAFDKSKGPLLLRQCSRGTPIGVSAHFDLSKIELDLLFRSLGLLTDSTSANHESLRKGQKINDFGYQLTGVIIDDRKYIYINAFRVREQDHWGQQPNLIPKIVCDGGFNYWGALFHLEKVVFSEVMYNGLG